MSSMKKNAIAFAVLLAASGPAAGGEYFWPSEVLALPAEVAATGGVVSVRGIVTFISGLEPNRFVVAPEDHPNLRGVEVVSSAQCEDLTCGAIVLVSGKAVERNGAVSLDATAVNILRVEEVEPPRVAKQADYRRGLLDGRVIELEGTVREIRPLSSGGVQATEILLLMDGYTATVRLPWRIDDDDFLGEPVRVSGFARAVFKDGKRVDSLLEVEKAEDIVSRRGRTAWRVLFVAAISLGGRPRVRLGGPAGAMAPRAARKARGRGRGGGAAAHGRAYTARGRRSRDDCRSSWRRWAESTHHRGWRTGRA